ncbi:MAG: hypothetical protein AAF297_04330 [Planctomycetota bacterium]
MPKGAVFWMILYALVLLDAGIAAYLLAPARTNATTALIVPAACATLVLLCAGASAMFARNRAVGMVGIHVGLVLPILFAAAFASRAMAASEASATYAEQQSAYRALGDAERPPTFAAYLDTLAEPGPDHDKTYLAVTLWRLTGLSGVAFVVLLTQRPKPTKRGAAEQSDDSTASA